MAEELTVLQVLKQKIASLETQLVAERDRVNSVDAESKRLRDERTPLLATIETLSEKLVTAQERLDTLDRDHVAVNTRVTPLFDLLTEIKSDVDALENPPVMTEEQAAPGIVQRALNAIGLGQ